MGKTKATRKRGSRKAPLSIHGLVVMPPKILPWERDLLAVVIEAFEKSERADGDDIPEGS